MRSPQPAQPELFRRLAHTVLLSRPGADDYSNHDSDYRLCLRAVHASKAPRVKLLPSLRLTLPVSMRSKPSLDAAVDNAHGTAP
jgi:hypothetical protein